MQPTRGGEGGGGGASRTGLSRFRSAPATWLEALLEDEEEDPLKPSQCLTHLLTSHANNFPPNDNDDSNHIHDANDSNNILAVPAATAASDLGFQAAFLRQNSLPADFGAAHDGLLSSPAYDIGSPSSFDLPPRSLDLLSPVKLERGGGLMDMEMDNLLEDSVAWRVRAKRGCATHPRSIAERVRRTRISDRIRKLQELVPNMDKQTNTADMLEEAVEYVKHLQKQIEELTKHQRSCKCTNKE